MEFEAVVLCGPGRRLRPVTPGTPKALIPVANKPVVSYALEWCAKAQFNRTTVAIDAEDYEQVAAYVSEAFPQVELFQVPANTESGEILGLLGSRLTRDFAILPCDFVTEADPEHIIGAHRAQDAEKALITGFYYQNTHEALDSKVLDAPVLVEAADEGLILDSSSRQRVRNQKRLQLRMAMLWKFPNAVAHTDMLPCGMYICSQKALQVLDEDVDLRGKIVHNVVRDIARRSWSHRQRRAGVALVRLDRQFLRVNSLPAYLEANRWMMRQRARSHQAQKPKQPKQSPEAAAIGADSLVAPQVPVGERSSVKRTVIGPGSSVGRKCRLTNCVLLENVRVDSDVVLENCIIGKGAVVESFCKLVGCQVEGNYRVVAETEAKNEVLQGLSMATLVDDDEAEFEQMYESLSDDESDDTDEEEDEEFVSDGNGDDFFDRS